MSVIGGQNTPSTNGLAYIIDFNNNYTSGSSIVNPILYLPTSSQFTGSVPNLVNGQIQFATGSVLRSFQNFPGFNPNTGNLTIMFSGEVKNNAVLFTQDGQMAVVGTTSSIGYGVPAGNVGRNFPNTGFDHVTLRFSTASVDCFINGVPVSASGIFPTVPSSSVNTDFKIGGNFISAWTGSLSGSLGQLMVYNRPLSDDEIYSNYLIQARRYGLPEIAKPYTVDSSVYVYTQAAGITDTVTLNALNTFVQGLKSASLWDKMVAIYPFIGTNPSASRLNLKDVSLNTTQVNYSGSWSTSLSGSRNNNTASYGILSNVKGDYVHPLVNSQSIHLSYLSYDTPTSGGYLMGVEQIPGLPGDIAQPAAAYSVRKVRTAYTGSAMTVRRDFDDVTFDVGFDGNGNLNTGSLLTNMTASGLTTTLPGDYSGLAAAYSLRKVSSSYSGYAVEVRRAVDNYSASIGFDASGNLNTASLASFIRTGSETPVNAYSGLAAAYSLRKVVPGYVGAAIEVQSGSVSQSIGFNSFGDLDVTAIRTFAGSGDAFVKTWFDQSGNNRHATQSSAAVQPQILSSGSIISDGVKTALRWNDSGTTNLSFSRLTDIGSVFYIARLTGTGTDLGFFLGDSINYDYASGWQFLPQAWFGSNTKAAILNGQNRINGVDRNFSTTARDLNRNLISMIHQSSTGVASTISNDRGIGGRSWRGFINEILIYTSSQAANLTYIENNINSYYGIYTPSSVSTENAFVKTWYDQSGNNRHATQSVDASQPQIVSNGLIVTQSGRPAVQFDGIDDELRTTTLSLGTTDYSVYLISKAEGLDSLGRAIFSITPTSNNVNGWYHALTRNNVTNNFRVFYSSDGNTSNAFAQSPLSAYPTTQTLVSSIVPQSGNILFNLNGVLQTSSVAIGQTINNAQLWVGNYYNTNAVSPTGYRHQGTISEIILSTSSLSSSRGLIEDNINGYYNIFTQSLASGSGYVTRWYDQSGNNRHAFQPTSSRQPLILSSGSVTFDGTTPGLRWDDGKWLDNFEDYTLQSMVWVARATSSVAGFKTIMNTQASTNVLLAGTFAGISLRAENTTYPLIGAGANSNDLISSNGSQFFNGNASSTSNNILNQHVGFLKVGTANTSSNGTQIGIHYNTDRAWKGFIKELILFSTDQSLNRQPIEQNANNYFNIYTPPGYNLNTNSLSLFSSPTTVAGAANNVASASFTTGGPLGLITVSRTGSSDYTLWKNRVPTKVTLSPSTASSSEIYLNAANVNNSLFSSSQNNIAYASVGAGLSDTEASTYYDLVNTFQTSLGRGVSNPGAFITTWDTRITGTGTISNTSSIVLPLFGTQAITASWGDGTTSLISQSTQVDRTHSYATPGIYTVSITGTGQGFQFNNGGDRAKLMDIVQWGSISGSTTSVFKGCFNLRGTAPDSLNIETTSLNNLFEGSSFSGYINNWNISRVTSLQEIFFNTSYNQPLNNWNTSNVTNIVNLVRNNTVFNQPLNNWNTSNVTSFNLTFAGASRFNQDIGSWNAAKVLNFSQMFSATSFNNSGSDSIRNWNVSSGTSFNNMFTSSPFNQPIGTWRFNTSSAINMGNMFAFSSFNQNIGAWNIEKVTDMSTMFQSATAFNNSGSSDINNWRPISCSTFSSMFQSATAFNQPIGNWTIGTGSNMNVTMSNMFNNADAFNQNIGAWNVEKVTSMASMFLNNGGFNNSGSSDINNWRPISCSNFSSMFNGATAFNQPIGNWPLSASNINMSSMFLGATTFDQNIGTWDTSRVTNMTDMFQNAHRFNQPIGSWNTSAVTNMTGMFYMYQTALFNQDISSWNTSAVTNMSNMFRSATAFNQPLNSWDVSNVTNMGNMFQEAYAFNQDIGSWNVSRVTSFTNFMANKTVYSYLHTIYDGWINYRLQPQRTITFSTIKYSGSAAEGRALLTRTYNTASITGYSNDGGQMAITCSVNHNVVAGNKVFISGSSFSGVNGVEIVFSTGSATTLTLTLPYDPSATGGTIFTGYGWNITDGGPV